MKTAVLLVTNFAFFVYLAAALNEIGTLCEDPDDSISVCFALDGSSSICPSAFSTQISVVLQTIEAIPPRVRNVRLAANQYGSSVTSISPFTSDRNAFRSAVRLTEQLQLDGTFVAAGLNYCISEFSERCGRENNIVLLGDGNNNIGTDPGERAEFFFALGGVIHVVGVGESQNITSLTSIAGDNPQRVFSVEGDVSVADISRDLSRLLFS
ncbi:von Willebrand factor A-like protein [Gracilaria domingensis]|nr:von Willebrand factor A-like protein [Gracilaria domingensis]KAI0561861.1 von Willebrand factor A-like protein [Gracilaria domingensis]